MDISHRGFFVLFRYRVIVAQRNHAVKCQLFSALDLKMSEIINNFSAKVVRLDDLETAHLDRNFRIKKKKISICHHYIEIGNERVSYNTFEGARIKRIKGTFFSQIELYIQCKNMMYILYFRYDESILKSLPFEYALDDWEEKPKIKLGLRTYLIGLLLLLFILNEFSAK